MHTCNDVHKQPVVAGGVIVPSKVRQPHKEVRTLGTMTFELQELSNLLADYQVRHSAMELTGRLLTPARDPRSRDHRVALGV
jgi:hypothetical protein